MMRRGKAMSFQITGFQALTLGITVFVCASFVSANDDHFQHIIKVADYSNPMKLNLKLLEGDDILGPEGEQRQYDYYKSKSIRAWAESYHLKPGRRNLREGNLRGAFTEFDFVLRYIPNHPYALAVMADITIMLNQPNIGDEYFKKAFALYPDTVRATSNKDYGRFLYRAGNHSAAIQYLTKAIEMDKNLSEAHYYIGLAYCARQEFTLANEHAQIIYSKGFPLSELREKLVEAQAWNPEYVPRKEPVTGKGKVGAHKQP